MKFVPNTLFAMIAIALISLSSCKPSVEGETNRWTEFQTAMTEQKSEYPQFSDAITEVETTATAAWAEAEKVADEEKKSEAMQAVNTGIKESSVHYLDQIPRLIEDIKKVSEKFTGKRMSKSLLDRLENAEEAAYDKIRSANGAIVTGAATSEEATALLKLHYDALSSSKSKMNSLWSAYKKEQKKKKKS